MSKATGFYFTNSNGNVCTQTKNWSSDQMWRFERQGDGSYKISSCKDSSVIEVYNFETTNGTNVTMNSNYNGNSAQRFFIYLVEGGYQIRAAFAPDGNQVDVDSASGNVQMWEQQNNDNQKFTISCYSAPNIGTPVVEVNNYGDSDHNVRFNWNTCENSTGYDLRVYDEAGQKVLYTFWNITNTSYLARIPSGTYQVSACALNAEFNTWTAGPFTKFTCSENLGTDFYSNIVGKGTGLYFTNSKGNVCVQQKNWQSDQMWHFILQSDGSYIIYSCKDGAAMEVYDFQTSNGTNVTMNANCTGNNAQKWLIYTTDGGYQLRAVFSPQGNVMDVDSTSGNVQMYESLNNNNQVLSISRLSPPKIGTPVVSVSETDNTDKNILFRWNNCDNATGYDLRIFDKEGKNILYTYWDIKTNNYDAKILNGTYRITVCAINSEFNLWSSSQSVLFSVKSRLANGAY